VKLNGFLRSALTREGSFHTTDELLAWLESRGEINRLRVDCIPFDALEQWSLDPPTGDLVHRSGKFFRVHGVRVQMGSRTSRAWDQPIIDQPEVGILGIVAKEFAGIPHFLMQAKVEPGNIGGVQVTPTVQATRSNYTQVHQGARPPYVDYFLDRAHATVLVDQLQPEQGSTFLRKRNRNIVVEVAGDIPVGDEHRWMTIGQVKTLLRVPNLVSMDARTVLSCIPYLDRGAPTFAIQSSGGTPAIEDALPAASQFGFRLLTSMGEPGRPAYSDEQVLGWLTDLKVRSHLCVERISLEHLRGWQRGTSEIVSEDGRYFRVGAVRVEAVNREVSFWDQPLVGPVEKGLIAFVVREINGALHFLVQGKIEPGNLDVVAVGPTVQCALGPETLGDEGSWPPFVDLVQHAPGSDVRYSCVQSEEGGRFYHVENEYRVVEIPAGEELDLPENYLWVSLRQLGDLLRHGLVNVEARSLLACLPLAE